jgi:hypothetical protein
VVLVAVAACASAATTAATLTSPPEDLKAAPRTSEIPVGQDHFDDAHNVQLSVTTAAPARLFAPGPGKVTSFACAGGSTVRSGETPFSLDGNPKLALATAIPLWRDLPRGTRGDDVRAFQDELSRLGFSLEADGVVGRNTIDAAEAVFARIGATLESGVVSVGSLVWIPAATVTTSTCETSVGADVQPGAVLATFATMAPKVSIVDLPTDLLPGPRLVKTSNSRFQVDLDGGVHVADVSALGIAINPDSPDSNSKPIEAEMILAVPIAVSVVPPGAVYNVQGSHGCVSSKGVRYRIQILGSQLGETLVNFVKGQAPTHVDTPPKHTASCA